MQSHEEMENLKGRDLVVILVLMGCKVMMNGRCNVCIL